ncbi:MAG TPA: hypothetical protein DDW36_03945 [Candidatus Magasanikbacteria bacterium]|nr:hypothetical protein [Candidatus Magasanikbacteria bacterium]
MREVLYIVVGVFLFACADYKGSATDAGESTPKPSDFVLRLPGATVGPEGQPYGYDGGGDEPVVTPTQEDTATEQPTPLMTVTVTVTGTPSASPSATPSPVPEMQPATSLDGVAFGWDVLPLDPMPHHVTAMVFLPVSEGNPWEVLLLTQREGIWHYRQYEDGVVFLNSFDVTAFVGWAECGVTTIAVDPHYTENHFLYFGRCTTPWEIGVVRCMFDGLNYEDVGRTCATIYSIERPYIATLQHVHSGGDDEDYSAHGIGQILFDRDGALVIPMGHGNDRQGAQNPETPGGTIIRIYPGYDGSGGYTPAQRPVDVPWNDLDIYTNGVRMPWNTALDANGCVWFGDVGDCAEELDRVCAPGLNYGFGTSLQGSCRVCNEDITENCVPRGCEPFTDPVLAYGECRNRHTVDGVVVDEWETRDDVKSSYDEFLRDGGLDIEEMTESDYNRRCITILTMPDEENYPSRYGGHLHRRLLWADMCRGFVRWVAVDEYGRITGQGPVPVRLLPSIADGQQSVDGYIYVATYGQTRLWDYSGDACDADVPGEPQGSYMLRLKLP